MSNRRRLARERLEYYLVYLIMAYQRLILIVGMLMLAYAIVVMIKFPITSPAILLFAVYLLLLSNSFKVAHYTARLAAWLSTLWMKDD
jgi:hypothetical protein